MGDPATKGPTWMWLGGDAATSSQPVDQSPVRVTSPAFWKNGCRPESNVYVTRAWLAARPGAVVSKVTVSDPLPSLPAYSQYVVPWPRNRAGGPELASAGWAVSNGVAARASDPASTAADETRRNMVTPSLDPDIDAGSYDGGLHRRAQRSSA